MKEHPTVKHIIANAADVIAKDNSLWGKSGEWLAKPLNQEYRTIDSASDNERVWAHDVLRQHKNKLARDRRAKKKVEYEEPTLHDLVFGER